MDEDERRWLFETLPSGDELPNGADSGAEPSDEKEPREVGSAQRLDSVNEIVVDDDGSDPLTLSL
jgi:hypothetical protein